MNCLYCTFTPLAAIFDCCKFLDRLTIKIPIPCLKAYWLSGLQLALLIIVQVTIGFSQVPGFRNISYREGLPASNIYDMLNDANGYVWFASDNGVIRYDGFEFTHYTTEQGLPFNSTLIMYEDYKGRIWFLSYSGELSYFENDRITVYPCNDSIKKHFEDNYIDRLTVDSLEQIWFSPRQGGIFMLDSLCRLTTINPIPRKDSPAALFFYDMGDDHFIAPVNPPGEMDHNHPELFALENKYFIPFKYGTRAFIRKYLKISDHNYLVSYGNHVYHIQDQKIIISRVMEQPVTCLTLDDKGNIWVSMEYGGGIDMFPGGNLDTIPKHFFEGYTITRIMQDREKNFWFSTTGDGVFFTPNMHFNIFPVQDKMGMNVITLSLQNDNIYFSSSKKGLFKADIKRGKLFNIRQLKYPGIINWIPDILPEDDGSLWVSNSLHSFYNPQGQPVKIEGMEGVFQTAAKYGNSIYLGGKGLAIIRDRQVKYDSRSFFETRVYALTKDAIQDDIYLATLYGLYKFDNDTILPLLHDKRLTSRINALASWNDFILIGSGSEGLLIMKNDSILYQLNSKYLLSGNTVREILIYNDSTVWLGMNNGLNRLVIKGNDSLQFTTDWISLDDGLPTLEIHAMESKDGFIWLATDLGLVSFEEKQIRPSSIPPLLKIIKIANNGIAIPLADSILLESGRNDLRIHFKGISFKGPESIKYRYRLFPYNTDIIYSNNPYADFPNLPPGKYRFFVNARYVNGSWGDPLHIDITVETPFTETALFVLLLSLLLILIIFAIIRIIVRYFKKREETRKTLLRLEQKYLRSQLNPHFIFNTLMAIQGIIYQQGPKIAAKYLANFAKLIRYITSITDKEWVVLENEIIFIRNYFELQKLRFGYKFDYNIQVQSGIQPEKLLIPPMMAQPFLENAIEHGLQNKTDKGNVNVEIKNTEQCLQIIITDDGIGREKASLLRNKEKSRDDFSSTQVITERIKLLNQVQRDTINLEIKDLYDNSGNPAGTMVIISLPLIFD